MSERDYILSYLPFLSDERAHRLFIKAKVEGQAQKTGEQKTPTERSLCAGVLANLCDDYAHMVYIFAKSLLDEQEKGAAAE